LQKELAQKDKRIEELEDILREFLNDEVSALDDMESILRQRRIKTESSLRKIR